jgi:endopolyphosphatase
VDTIRLRTGEGLAQGKTDILMRMMTQYYLPKLEEATKKHKPKFELEYVTFAPNQLHSGEQEPIPLRHLPKSLREPGVVQSKFAPYEMEDLTIPSWIKLAKAIGTGKSKRLRKKFFSYMYMGGPEN